MTDAAPSTRMIRVVLAGFAGLGAASVRGCLSGHHDIAIVTEMPMAEMLDSLPDPTNVDVLVTMRSSKGVPGPCREQLFAEAGVPVISISDDGRRIEIYDKRVLREAALAELLAEVRRVALPSVASR